MWLVLLIETLVNTVHLRLFIARSLKFAGLLADKSFGLDDSQLQHVLSVDTIFIFDKRVWVSESLGGFSLQDTGGETVLSVADVTLMLHS